MTDHIAHTLLLARLQDVAASALTRYDLPSGATATLINVSENATYRVELPSSPVRYALRIHRDGYHSTDAIRSEIAWQIALRDGSAVTTPVPVAGRDGAFIQSVAHADLPVPRNVVLYQWESGKEPEQTNEAGFELLGETAAHMHAHVKAWKRPAWFTRHTWDFETMLGSTPHWGRWRDGMGLTPAIEAVFAKAVGTIEARLKRFGQGPERFGLVHGDMRLANLLIDSGAVKVIDFDDCGFSWFLYDCATTVSFFEHEPEVPNLLKAWARGYRRIGHLSAEDEAEIETFVMLRRLLLVAWIGSHSETDLAQSMGVDYTRGTVALCEQYLASSASKGILVAT